MMAAALHPQQQTTGFGSPPRDTRHGSPEAQGIPCRFPVEDYLPGPGWGRAGSVRQR